MHELGLAESIVDAVEQRAGGRNVVRIKVRIGTLHHVHPDAFAQSFSLAAAGSVAEAATAELVLIEVSGQCQHCGEAFQSDGPVICCPSCGGFDVVQTGGDELILEELEYQPA